ncbi:hypothetical protein WH47_06020 [Habropoda laboriosa]|uniref:Uncharacterized protein n=1 Tax=Habropoda laboriosa TaxID=597456 RepID=A0A0L7QRU6_9HYME|nr:hypothetical protein WH47_06020 [Habropoda laboriosa]
MGRFKKTFTGEFESQLVCYMKDQDAKFMPLSKTEFLKLAYDLAEHLKLPHQFNKLRIRSFIMTLWRVIRNCLYEHQNPRVFKER